MILWEYDFSRLTQCVARAIAHEAHVQRAGQAKSSISPVYNGKFVSLRVYPSVVEQCDYPIFLIELANLTAEFTEHQQETSESLIPSAYNHPPEGSDRVLIPGSSRRSLGQRSDPDLNEAYQVDALATVSSGNNDDCFYGGSSTIAFVHQFADSSRADGSHARARAEIHSSGQHASQTSVPARPPHPTILLEKSESAFVHPVRRKADDFLHCFWEFIHPVFPVVYKTSFIAKYEKLWIPATAELVVEHEDDEAEALFLSSLNLVFALGCQFSTMIQDSQRRSTADDFYKRSRRLYIFDILDSRSIASVQMLLLAGIYLQSTPDANRCWNSIGLAVRLAQSQGLHLDNTGRKPESQLTCQIRRRVWHTCVMLDMYVPMYKPVLP